MRLKKKYPFLYCNPKVMNPAPFVFESRPYQKGPFVLGRGGKADVGILEPVTNLMKRDLGKQMINDAKIKPRPLFSPVLHPEPGLSKSRTWLKVALEVPPPITTILLSTAWQTWPIMTPWTRGSNWVQTNVEVSKR